RLNKHIIGRCMGVAVCILLVATSLTYFHIIILHKDLDEWGKILTKQRIKKIVW
ncbi:unnamed protein product, partial [marine sediment metagenome]